MLPELFSQALEIMKSWGTVEEQPCPNVEGEEESCYSCCVDATDPAALAVFEAFVNEFGLLPTSVYSGRNGDVSAIWRSARSTYHKSGHYIDGEEFTVNFSSKGCNGFWWKQMVGGNNPSTSRGVWSGSGREEILVKLAEFVNTNGATLNPRLIQLLDEQG